ncbi:MAG: trypsin-like peptidase domain-containing protein [Fusicatenibacter sp.]|nr:trypsin-like peptidase domain-containing protein [Fusicatenibacter sp.]
MSDEFTNNENEKRNFEQDSSYVTDNAKNSTNGHEEKKESATTYSWVNPKISGKATEEDNSASYTGQPEIGSDSRNERSNPYQQPESQPQPEPQPQPQNDHYTYQTIEPQDHRKKAPKEKKPMSVGKKWGMTLAMAACFGLVAGVVFTGTSAAGMKLFGTNQQNTSVTIPTTATTVTTGSSGNTSDGMSVKDVAANAMPSLVSISTITVEEVQTFFGTTSQEVPASGTGVIVGQNEDELLIATNNHVVSGATTLSVTFIDDQTISGQIKGTDSTNDLAVVAVKLDDIPEETLNQIKIAVMGDSDELEVGEQVVAIGNALGTGQSVTSGYVSALDRTISSEDESTGETITSEGLIQTDAAINPGNSGGALLNMKGELIGINEAKYSSTQVEGMGFAIPISKAEPILQELMNMTTRYKVEDDDASYIGINMADVSSDASQSYGIPSGVCIMNVMEGSPAEQAGMKKGDVITKFDGRTVTNATGLKEILTYYAAGETVDVIVQRADNGEYKEVTITLTLGSAKDMPTSSNGSSGSSGNSDNSGNSKNQITNPFGNN